MARDYKTERKAGQGLTFSAYLSADCQTIIAQVKLANVFTADEQS